MIYKYISTYIRMEITLFYLVLGGILQEGHSKNLRTNEGTLTEGKIHTHTATNSTLSFHLFFFISPILRCCT